MNQDYNNPAFKKLLQKLQEESWQLELLISGFAIFGLFQAIKPLGVLSQEARTNDQILVFTIFTVAAISCLILLFNLLLHVILRGLWIGALGLRYVSGDIDFEKLNYSPKFTKYLKKRIVSFDRYIASLENYCSVIFAISFLLIFYVLAFTLIIGSIVFVAEYILSNENLSETVRYIIGIPLLVFIVFGMLLSFFDFLSQGWLKKKQWISKLYFPIYWVFSFLTLSFLYRPLVYNFLDNKFGKRLSFFLVPIYILILVGTSFKYQKSNYIELGSMSTDQIAHTRNYENLINKDDGIFIKSAAIPSKVISDSFLKIFLVFSDTTEDLIFEYNKGLKPIEDSRGLHSQMQFGTELVDFDKRDSLKAEYMRTLKEIHIIKIDSTSFNPEFVLGKSLTDEFGFETYLDISNLNRGKHLLKVWMKKIKKEDTLFIRRATIPFWYYPD
ncbi:MAG: hypothetical protein HKN40_00155 [Winogradskyella sp.]|uniref:hypothetical protein n=1 Tax=Winogradskyella sp. TaxID=1883156 RepID=UPI00185A5E91|nr:hypothetical protein [Winogradskyella sp.]